MIETDTITLPAAWASALVNGDYTSFDYDDDDAGAARCEAAEAELAADGWSIADTVGEPYFTWSYQLYDGGADCSGGEVQDYTILRAVADIALTPEG
jgi:hypothetical protein